MTHPYWTPQDWLGGALVVEWYHDLSKLFFCGGQLNYYDLRLSLGTDTENNPSVAWRPRGILNSPIIGIWKSRGFCTARVSGTPAVFG